MKTSFGAGSSGVNSSRVSAPLVGYGSDSNPPASENSAYFPDVSAPVVQRRVIGMKSRATGHPSA